MEQEHCAWCCEKLGSETGESSIYGSPNIVLCAPCFHEEDALIEREGTNNIPEQLEMYVRNIEDHG